MPLPLLQDVPHARKAQALLAAFNSCSLNHTVLLMRAKAKMNHTTAAMAGC